LGSNSASSLSEFSSTTGTDERSLQSPLRDTGTGSSTPIDIEPDLLLNGRVSPILIHNSGFRGDFCIDTEFSLDAPDGQPFIPIILTDEPKPVVRAKSNEDVRKKFSKANSVDIQDRADVYKQPLKKAASVDQSNTLNVDRRSRKFWENSLVVLESDSESEDSLNQVDSFASPSLTPGIDNRLDNEEPINPDYAKIEIIGPHSPNSTDQDSLSSDKAPTYARLHTSIPEATPQYTNIQIALKTPPTETQARGRSKSSSPLLPKKPKPLPRLKIGPQDSRTELISSLPGDFKPSPPPKPTKVYSVYTVHVYIHTFMCCVTLCTALYMFLVYNELLYTQHVLQYMLFTMHSTIE